MLNFSKIKKSLLTAIWFMFLTFPIMVIHINPVEKAVEWRWHNMFLVGAGSFLLSLLWHYLIKKKERCFKDAGACESDTAPFLQRFMNEPRLYKPALSALTVISLSFPFLFSSYQVNIMTTALMYAVLGLGLNIVVGLAGLLDLGYVAFYAVGAYSYALLNHHFGLGFWTVLPVGALLGALFGILLGFPVLRLRGDYLAIVTLGFGEIIRLILENWNEFSFGPSGIANIARPSFFGMQFPLKGATIYIYFLMIALALFTVFVVSRLQNSRIGRAWEALREDEIACQAMGIDKTRTKLSAFALGATWAGMMGVVFAARTTFINPASFTFIESAIILSIVVLGGMGSIPGVIAGAFILILLPEHLRVFSEYRMLIFGAVLIIMMVFRPQGMISMTRRIYRFENVKEGRGIDK
ncbi:MAG: branched-chain amino acid ABC transporter permease [Nitrospirae bacterium]|nr:branched-chain amino acid ABC transporter permease [Nitrospirota bacterium]